jgi:uncharacterized protein involved in exopolysaccharide biosynthesis
LAKPVIQSASSSPFGQIGDENESLDIKQYLFLFLGNWYWLALGLLFGLAGAWLNLRYSPVIYNVSSSILINEQQKQAYSTDIIAEDLGLQARSDINNELRVLKSSDLMRRVVDSLELNIKYHQEGNIRTSELYGKDKKITVS